VPGGHLHEVQNDLRLGGFTKYGNW